MPFNKLPKRKGKQKPTLAVQSPSILVFQNSLTIFMTLLKLTSQHKSVRSPSPRSPSSLLTLLIFYVLCCRPAAKTAALQFVSRATDSRSDPSPQSLVPCPLPKVQRSKKQLRLVVYVCSINIVVPSARLTQSDNIDKQTSCSCSSSRSSKQLKMLELAPSWDLVWLADFRHLTAHWADVN